MKTVTKEAQTQTMEPLEGELGHINRLARRELTAEEVYTFAVRLCDNQTDRDEEYFDRAALEKLAGLFVGKTGIFDHSWSAKDQTARLYRTELVEEPGVVTQAGTSYVEIPAWAVLPGPQGNTPAGTIRTMAVAPAGVAFCTNPAAFTGGCEEEGDEALRMRVLESYRSLPNGTNAAYYRQEAQAVDGVSAVTVLPKNRGLGTVDLYITAPQGLPSGQLLAAVQNHLKERREIGVDLRVLAPDGVKVDVLVTVKVRAGLDPEPVRQAVSAALETFFDGSLLGQDLLLAQLGQVVYQVEGVENYKFYAPANDRKVGPGELPVLGTLSVEEMP